MKKKFKKFSLIVISIFIVMFIFRLVYGYIAYPTLQDESPNDSSLQNYRIERVKNYATYNQKVNKSDISSNISVEQKYEKIASIASRTEDFPDDSEKISALVEEYNALIQFEKNIGNEGDRVLELAIGVDPQKFDDFVEAISQIGNLKDLKIEKFDKTNEYQDLKAQRESLIQTKNSLVELKKQGGTINELITLENRILDIEQQLQALGVSLGEFDSENEFCTVEFSLTETEGAASPLAYRIKVAFEWTVEYFFLMDLAFIFGVVAVLFVEFVVKRIINIYKKNNKIFEG